MDSQTTEIIGTNLVVASLLRDGVEVARPERDRGIDLIAYVDLDEKGRRFVARPLQIKAATVSSFGIWRKYERFPGLLLCFVWHLHDPSQSVMFCLSHAESVAIADAMGWTRTASWTEKGGYSTTRPGAVVRSLLSPYEVTNGFWRERLRG